MNLEQKTLTSIEVAEMVGKDHKELLRDIRRYSTQLNESNIALVDFFQVSTYQDSKNEERPCYLVTKKGCEFIGHKITGTKGAIFTAKYINRFHEMEDQIARPKTHMELLELEFQAIKEVDSKIDSVNKDLQDFKKDMSLLALECQKITNAKNQVVVNLMGGKESNSYKDNSLRGRVYRDLESQLKREFGVDTYKAIKRSQCELAISIIKGYKLPLALIDEIENANAQMNIA